MKSLLAWGVRKGFEIQQFIKTVPESYEVKDRESTEPLPVHLLVLRKK